MRLYYKYILGFVIIMLMHACLNEPKSEEAKVGEAETAKEVEHPMTNYYLPEPHHITWIGTKPTGRHNGTIRLSQGFVSVRNDSILGGKFTLDMNDIHILDLESDPANHDKLSNHLKSPDFFDVANHPHGYFVLTRIEPYTSESEEDLSVEGANSMVTGNLTLRDSTLSVTFPSRVYLTDSIISVAANFNIDRTRWGVSYRDETKVSNKIKDKFIHNKVNIGFDIEIKK